MQNRSLFAKQQIQLPANQWQIKRLFVYTRFILIFFIVFYYLWFGEQQALFLNQKQYRKCFVNKECLGQHSQIVTNRKGYDFATSL